MANACRYRRCGFLLPALTLVWSALLCAPYAAAVEDHPLATNPPATPATMAKYRQELAAYLQAREAYQAAAKTYWASIAEKRRLRSAKRARGAALSIDDYVLDQPPVYSGPPKPRDPSKPPEPAQPPPYVPVVADFLAAAVNEFKFTPRLPRNDSEFKRAYVATALTTFKPAANTTRAAAPSPRRSATINCWRQIASKSSPKTASISSLRSRHRRSNCRTTRRKL